MKTESPKLRQDQRSEQEQKVTEQTGTEQQAQEFASVEDLLRFDNQQNPVPGDVSERLNNSIAAEPKSEKPWYRRLFGG